jgi:hypothetical protein
MNGSSRTVEHVGEWSVELRADAVEGIFAALTRTIAKATGSPSGAWSDWEDVALEARDPDLAAHRLRQ